MLIHSFSTPKPLPARPYPRSIQDRRLFFGLTDTANTVIASISGSTVTIPEYERGFADTQLKKAFGVRNIQKLFKGQEIQVEVPIGFSVVPIQLKYRPIYQDILINPVRPIAYGQALWEDPIVIKLDANGRPATVKSYGKNWLQYALLFEALTHKKDFVWNTHFDSYWARKLLTLHGTIDDQAFSKVQRQLTLISLANHSRISIENPGYWDEEAETFLEEILELQEPIRTFLLSSKRMGLVETVISKFPRLKNKEAHGHGPGKLYNRMVGVYYGNKYLAVARCFHPDDNLNKLHRAGNIGGTVRHEIGHAISDELAPFGGARLSGSMQFRSCYNRDRVNWSSGAEEAYQDESREEICAGIIQALLLVDKQARFPKPVSGTHEQEDISILKNFPETACYIKQKIESRFKVTLADL